MLDTITQELLSALIIAERLDSRAVTLAVIEYAGLPLAERLAAIDAATADTSAVCVDARIALTRRIEALAF